MTGTQSPTLISIIIVGWRSKDLIRRCLTSIYNSKTTFQYDVIVIDNDSGDGTVKMVASEFPKALCIANPVNAGFGTANNIGAKRATGKYLFILNPDTILEASTLERLLAAAQNETNLGALNPRVTNTDGTPQVTAFRRLPS